MKFADFFKCVITHNKNLKNEIRCRLIRKKNVFIESKFDLHNDYF